MKAEINSLKNRKISLIKSNLVSVSQKQKPKINQTTLQTSSKKKGEKDYASLFEDRDEIR